MKSLRRWARIPSQDCPDGPPLGGALDLKAGESPLTPHSPWCIGVSLSNTRQQFFGSHSLWFICRLEELFSKELIMKTGYLIDMDGVIYRENHLIAGAAEFVQALTATGTPFIFLDKQFRPHAGGPGRAPQASGHSRLVAADTSTPRPSTPPISCAPPTPIAPSSPSARAACWRRCMNRRFPTTPSALITSWSAKAPFRWKN